ncbi:MAG: TAT-variant-translocated molybdopterin oxidoreductase [Candidatus Binatia bacterium]
MGFDPTAPEYDLSEIREKLSKQGGRTFWRSLDEVADTPEFRGFLNAEFPSAVDSLTTSLDRRQFLKLMGASLAMSGLSACTRQPVEKILPYVKQPEELLPGQPLYYASAFPLGGSAFPVLVESHMGRPTKIEGNPDHPASLGSTTAITQGSVLDLYDPDRSQAISRAGQAMPWENFATEAAALIEKQKGEEGAGLRFLSEPSPSPTFAATMKKVLAALPKARWHQWEPVGRENERAGSELAFGRIVDARYDLRAADVIVSFEGDFLFDGAGQIRHTKDFTARRRIDDASVKMNRLYVIESTPSVTGGKADHRLPLSPSQVAASVRLLAAELGMDVARPKGLDANAAAWIKAAAKDLASRRGTGLVLAGPSQDATVHALCHAINSTLGNAGRTVLYTESCQEVPPTADDGLAALVADMKGGKVEGLVILGGNPVYGAPADLGFAAALQSVAFTAHLSTHDDETSRLCLWHLPAAHYLESWGDVRTWDGTVTIVQPLVEPLYSGHTALEVAGLFAGETGKTDYDRVREHWKQTTAGVDFDTFWNRAVHDGFVPGTQRGDLGLTPRADLMTYLAQLPSVSAAGDALELTFRADASSYDGRFANNGWLQELPRPWTRLVWDNAVLVSPALAGKQGLGNGDVVKLVVGDASVEGPVWILPGMAANTVSVQLGYGRARAGHVGTAVGFDANLVRSSKSPWAAAGVTLQKTGTFATLVTTQAHHSMEGRDLYRSTDLASFRKDPEGHHHHHPSGSMYPDWKYEGYAWGMAIDLAACIGCNACTIACQAENNIAVVGKDQVSRGREMHWIRIDRYFEGDLDNPTLHNQPVACQQCEKAPCEVVCPVNATNHSNEGLNDMVYNRCVGTRYCANNCPYKVRRFNFLLYTDWENESVKMQRNPDVTVRSRGVMEKCTYCVQRINVTRNQARREGRAVRDGEIVVACEQACPSDAIIFGDINDEASKVAKAKASPRGYAILAELGTKPRTTYLKDVTNPNPEIVALAPQRSGGHAGQEGGHS